MTEDKSFEQAISEVAKSLASATSPLESGLCAWGGCAARFDVQMPPQWIRLKLSRHHARRDEVLCPKHACDLEDMLKGVGLAPDDVLDVD